MPERASRTRSGLISDAIATLGSYDAGTTRLLKAGSGLAKRLGELEELALRAVWQTLLRRAEAIPAEGYTGSVTARNSAPQSFESAFL